MRIAFAAALVLAFAAPTLAAEHTVKIVNFAFDPPSLSVAAGDTVVFVNQDQAPHTATARDGAFDTGRLAPGQSARVEITRGSHDYFCQIHPAMTGQVKAGSSGY
jgi:plastocyanin